MEELYVEGVATQGGPESCVVVCEGGGEALTGARAGRAIEPRNVKLVRRYAPLDLPDGRGARGSPARSGFGTAAAARTRYGQAVTTPEPGYDPAVVLRRAP